MLNSFSSSVNHLNFPRFKMMTQWMQWHLLVIPAFGNLGQEDYIVKDNLGNSETLTLGKKNFFFKKTQTPPNIVIFYNFPIYLTYSCTGQHSSRHQQCF